MLTQSSSRRFVVGSARTRAAGFTIIEVVLVVAVLAVVAALALPAYTSRRERVHIAQAVIDIKGIEPAVNTYRNDNIVRAYDGRFVGLASDYDP